jgi:hypothetical protein
VLIFVGMSSYAPGWVKKDHKRFPRVQISDKPGTLIAKTQALFTDKPSPLITRNCLSLFSPNAVQADAKAFTELMKHLKEIDGEENTVIMVQVENEVGILGDSRDRSGISENAFKSAVPSDLVRMLKDDYEILTPYLQRNLKHFTSADVKGGEDWETTFGKSQQTDEIFMAYHYALYCEQVAKAGKAVYPLPLYTNAWLRNLAPEGREDDRPPVVVGGGTAPGDYPTGGPIETVLDIWQHYAPTFEFLSPDIYFADYLTVCRNSYPNNDVMSKDVSTCGLRLASLAPLRLLHSGSIRIDQRRRASPNTMHF